MNEFTNTILDDEETTVGDNDTNTNDDAGDDDLDGDDNGDDDE